ncbi:MAG TPA: DUF4118 domain-containing protein [Acidimicrobiales bacterium]|nr:DUF4118 domain-containing protein [Acidimicrobiales bacterium]
MRRVALTSGSEPAGPGRAALWHSAPLAGALACLAAAAVPAGVAAAFIPLRQRLPNLDLALVLVVVVMALSTSGRRAVVVIGSIVAALSFEFFATEPYERLAIARQPDLETTVVLAVVALAAGECARRVVRQRAAAAVQAANLRYVSSAARMLADGNEPVEVVGAVAAELCTLLELSDCRFEARLPTAGATRVERDGSLVSDGAGTGATSRLGWAELPVFAQGEQLGYFVLRFAAGVPAPPAKLQVAATLADQAGAALAAYGPAMAPPPDGAPVSRGLHLLS